MKKTDRIIINVILLIITFAWCLYFIEFKPLAFLIASGIFCIENLIIRFLSKRKGGASISKFNQHLAVHGHAYTLELVKSAINAKLNPKIEDDAIIIFRDNRLELVYCSVKFAQSSTEDVAKAIRLAIKKNVNFIHFVSNGIDRRALNIINTEYVKFNFMTTKPFLARLEKLNLVPEFNYKKNSAKSLKTIISIALNKKNAPRLLLVGLVMLVLSFATPLKGYYLVMATISALLAAVCMFNKQGESGSNNIFR